MQQGLPLARTAIEAACGAVRLHLRGVTREGAPALDLERVDVGNAPPHPVAAIPLEPAARIRADDPAVLAPDLQALAAFDFEAIERGVGNVRELRLLEPVRREFVAAIVHVFPLEHAEREHFPGGEMRFEVVGEFFPRRRVETVLVIALHGVADVDKRGEHKVFTALTKILSI